MTDLVLKVEGLTVRAGGVNGRAFDIVSDLSFSVGRGEVLAIVGESGSGKSSTALSLLGLLPPALRIDGGEVELAGERSSMFTEKRWQGVRGRKAAMIFQDPLSAFNPVRTVGSQLVESIRRHQGLSSKAACTHAEQCLRAAGVPSPRARLDAYPHQLSGGLRQRAMIALALANEPVLLIADEPTAALDATIQAQILRLLKEGCEQRATLLITHDLALASALADRVAVMYHGRFVEHGPADAVLRRSHHPYTAALVALVPDLRSRELGVPIPGNPAQPHDAAQGCAFQPRCARATAHCAQPPLATRSSADPDHTFECWHPLRDATG